MSARLTQKHWRKLQDRLLQEGFSVLHSWHGRHLRMHIERNGTEGYITCSSSPRNPEFAINNTLQQARRTCP